MLKARRIFSEHFWQIVSFIVPLIVYLCSELPQVGLWDTGEMATVPYIFGIAHPTGFPAYILLGWLWSHFFVVGNVAWRMAVLSSLSCAAASWLLYRTARRGGEIAAPIACCAALLFAFGEVSWSRATRAEIHTLALCCTAGAVALAEAAERRAPHAFFLIPVLLAFGIATHPVVVWALPGIAFLLADNLALRNAGERKREWLALARGALAGTLLFAACYATIPVRSTMISAARIDPTLALGLAPGAPFWDYGHPATPAGFLWLLEGKQFQPQGALLAILQITAYPAYAAEFVVAAGNELTPIALPFALWGLITAFRRSPLRGFGYAALALLSVPFALAYRIEIDSARYFLQSFWILAILAAWGVADAFSQAVILASRQNYRRHYLSVSLAATLLFGLAGWVMSANRAIFTQPENREGPNFIARIAQETPLNAVIVVPWVYATPLAYARYVENTLGKRIIVSGEPADFSYRYADWAKVHPLFVVDDGAQPFVQRGMLFAARDSAFPRLEHVSVKPVQSLVGRARALPSRMNGT